MHYTMSEIHAQWHSVHGHDTVCPLDCGVNEGRYDEDEQRAAWEAEQEAQQAFITRS